MRAIIIDDMKLARETLKADINEYCPQVQIVGEASGVIDAAKLLRTIDVDLIFLDIHMEDGEGFDLLDILPELKTKVIFTTASDEHAIKAFQYAAIDYLLKPIMPELLVKAVDKSKDNPDFSLVNNEILKNTDRNSIVLSTSDELRVVEIKQIVRCQSDGNYTNIFLADDSKIMVTKTLKEYDNLLNENLFIRVHQSHLVNIEYIKSYVKTEGGYLLLKNDECIPVSVRKKPFVMKVVSEIK